MGKRFRDMNSLHNVTVIRHAESLYNVAQRRALNTIHEVMHNEDINVKFDLNLVDCGISPEGEEQSKRAAEQLKDQKIRIVFTSPLRRCLQTTRIIFDNHPDKPRVVVLPALKEILSSSCDIGSDIKALELEYPDYDFRGFESYEIPSLWYLYEIQREEHTSAVTRALKEKFPTEDLTADIVAPVVTQYLKSMYPEAVETQKDINARVLRAKDYLRKQPEFEEEGKAVVVAHSRFLEAFTASGFEEENGAPIGARWLKNAEVYDTTF
eukprot:TRINITY_DN8074_c0_g1_i1.p1 TRINITY_DN8074_c0_g1~~TRINITY_DN8074_c0_g1_i1.p1  ORF type:complete len:267 (+),score=49.94 TRINITY_DN8074_c0_g1_i1:94-894(+)